MLWAPPAAAQTFGQRGVVEGLVLAYPQSAARDDTRLVADSLFRYEPSLKAGRWRFDAAVDARMDSHGMTNRRFEVSYWDRTIGRPALAVARASASWARGPITVELGKQFLRWGKTDILVPTDRFAPRDYIGIVQPELLGVTAARVTVSNASDSLDLVATPRLTPSRTPLLDQRWVIVPAAAADVPLSDAGARYPGAGQFGIRWNHIGRRLEHSISFFRGFNHLPFFTATVAPSPLRIEVERRYAQMTSVGADLAAPLSWFTLKAESAWFHSDMPEGGEYLQYVIQLERQSGEWLFIGGYAGEYERRAAAPFRFAPDRGLARAFVGRASRTLDANRELVMEGVLRQNGKGAYARVEYSQGFGGHWRGIATVTGFGGSDDDFLGQYRRNSGGRVMLRYSF